VIGKERNMEQILKSAQSMQEKLVEYRRYLHKNAEVGMDLPSTTAFVKKELEDMGYEPRIMGQSGLLAQIIGKKAGKTVLLRADMDALPIKEEADVSFKCDKGAMHACGHDFHTSMLLGAAKILKEREDSIEGTIKLMFQPGEEVLKGALAMIEEGVLEGVDRAMMIHVISGWPIPAGAVLIPSSDGPVMAGADWFDITIQGKGGHGAMPEFAVDPLNVAAHTHIALQVINSREASRTDPLAMTVGVMKGGSINNVIPDKAELSGTIRYFTPQSRDLARKRLNEIAEGTAKTFRAEAEVNLTEGVPPFVNNGELAGILTEALTLALPEGVVMDLSALMPGSKSMGSEDFAFVSELVPTTQVSLAAGSSEKGHVYPMHHPGATFDESALAVGTAVYVLSALAMLNNKDSVR
jgi:amidohydrolase